MAKYMFHAALSLEGLKGTVKEGGTARRKNLEKVLDSVGGSLEAFYYAFGEDDLIIIADLPDNVAAAALATTVTTSGVGGVKTTVLLTPEEVDEASKRQVKYTPPKG
ncbi:hypothetical protein BH18ACT5_BH18ACT5_07650 [soil metagenome]